MLYAKDRACEEGLGEPIVIGDRSKERGGCKACVASVL